MKTRKHKSSIKLLGITTAAAGIIFTTGFLQDSSASAYSIVEGPPYLLTELNGLETKRLDFGGTIKLNKSIDGNRLSVGGKTNPWSIPGVGPDYSGIGTHANSEIVYNLNGLYDKFTTSIGVDDEVRKNHGSVIFKIYADNELLYTSPVMKSGDSAKDVAVSVKGKQQLKLVVDGTKDGITNDHADWLHPYLTPVWTADRKAPAETYAVQVDKNYRKGSLTVNGQTYSKGYGLTAGTSLKFNLAPSITEFTTKIGIDDASAPPKDAVFKIYADGELLFEKIMKKGENAHPISVPVHGKKELVLSVDSANARNDQFFDLIDPKLLPTQIIDEGGIRLK